MFHPNPIIIIGAPRSGTKILRDLLIYNNSDLVGVPYELERVWLKGEKDKSCDELDVKNITLKKTKYVQQAYLRISKGKPGIRVVDKTVANSLRMGYVRSIFPNCQFIHICRDGRDAISSLREMWISPLETSQLSIELFKHMSLEDIIYFAYEQIRFYFQKYLGPKGYVRSWGPRFKDMKNYVRRYSLIEVCAYQWKKCINAILDYSKKLTKRDYLLVRYEDLVRFPEAEINKISNFLNLKNKNKMIEYAHKKFYDKDIGRWRYSLSKNELDLIYPIIKDEMCKLSYF